MHFDWNKVLAPDETIRKEFGVSPKYRNMIFVLTTIAAIITFFDVYYMGLFIFFIGWLYWFYLKKAKHYAFTDRRIVMADSFLGRSIISIDYTQLTDIEIEQSTLDEAGGWGTIIFNSAGTHSPQMKVPFIDNPLEVKQVLDTIRDSHSMPDTKENF